MIKSIINISSTLASFVGAYITYCQYKKTKQAKDAVETYRNEIIKNQQIIELPNLLKETNKFITLLISSQKSSNSRGKDENSLNVELEKFLTKLNRIIGILNNISKEKINTHYEKLTNYRNKVQNNDSATILRLLNDIRNFERTITEIQQDNTLKT